MILIKRMIDWCIIIESSQDDMERVQRSAVDGDNTGSSHRYAYGDDYTFTLSAFPDNTQSIFYSVFFLLVKSHSLPIVI